MAMAIVAGGVMAVSCGNDEDLIRLTGDTRAASGAGEALYEKARASDEAGKRSKAIDQYEKVADNYPSSPSAGMARFRQAELLEEEGKIMDSFDAYQQFLQGYQGSGLYSQALAKQTRMAQEAADGKVKEGFTGLGVIGLKRKVSVAQAMEMLGKVRDNAPRSETSARAQFTIGELYQSDFQSGKTFGGEDRDGTKAIAAYRKLVRDQPDSKYSAEAMFRVGVVLLKQADRGNRNQATLDLADETFRDYLTQYPGHAKNSEARQLMSNLKSNDLTRSLEIAEYYDSVGQTESAKIYYRAVLRNSASGPAYEKSKARLKELGE